MKRRAIDLGQLVVLSYGIYMIAAGQLTVGLLIGFLLYTNSFYMPLRQLAVLWSSLQLALAAVDRISDVLAEQTDRVVILSTTPSSARRWPSGAVTRETRGAH